MDLSISALRESGIAFNYDGSVELTSAIDQSTLLLFVPKVKYGSYVISLRFKGAEKFRLYSIESNYIFDTLSRQTILTTLKERLAKDDIEVEELTLHWVPSDQSIRIGARTYKNEGDGFVEI